MRPTREEFIEQVRVNLSRYLEANRGVTIEQMARRTGYAEQTIHKFRAGTIVTMPVAVALVASYAELGRELCCPCCGHYLHPDPIG